MVVVAAVGASRHRPCLRVGIRVGRPTTSSRPSCPPAIVELLTEPGGQPRELDERDEAMRSTLLVEHFGGSLIPASGAAGSRSPGRARTTGARRRSASRRRRRQGVVDATGTGLPAGVTTCAFVRYVAWPASRDRSCTSPGSSCRPVSGCGVPATTTSAAPTLGADAYHGPVGDYLRLLDDRTEAHPAAIGFSALTYLGCWLGRAVTFTAGPGDPPPPGAVGRLRRPDELGRQGHLVVGGRLLLDALDRQIVAGHTRVGVRVGRGARGDAAGRRRAPGQGLRRPRPRAGRGAAGRPPGGLDPVRDCCARRSTASRSRTAPAPTAS